MADGTPSPPTNLAGVAHSPPAPTRASEGSFSLFSSRSDSGSFSLTLSSDLPSFSDPAPSIPAFCVEKEGDEDEDEDEDERRKNSSRFKRL